MRKEARYNLIFFIALLALCAPGVMMLVKRKLSQPPRDQIGLVAPVRMEVPYVDPLPVWTNLRLTYPPRLRGWVRTLSPSAPAESAHISQHRSFELLECEPANAQQVRVAVLIWDPRIDVQQAVFALEQVPASTQSITCLTPPPAVLSELRQLGYLSPPEQVPQVQLVFPAGARLGDELRLTGTRDGKPFVDSLRLPD